MREIGALVQRIDCRDEMARSFFFGVVMSLTKNRPSMCSIGELVAVNLCTEELQVVGDIAYNHAERMLESINRVQEEKYDFC